MKDSQISNPEAETKKELIEEAAQINTFMPHHNKGMQTDLRKRYALAPAADAGR